MISILSWMEAFVLNNIAMLPIAIGLLMAPVMLFLKSRPKLQKFTAIAVSALLLILSAVLFWTVYKNGIQVYDIGEFGKYGIVLVGDMLSASLVLLTSFIGFFVLIYSFDYIEKKSLSESYFPLYFLMLTGIYGIFLTGDLFNLFVFFEIMFLSSTGLIMANESLSVTDTAHKLEATYKYMALGMIGSFMLLVAIVTIYASVGSLNMADIAAKVQIIAETGTIPWVIIAAALLFIVVFGNKAALVPLHFWLPDVHPTAPTPISAMLSGILIKVGAYGILRVLFLILYPTKEFFLPILMFFALLTIAVGAISAMGQTDLKRVLAYSSVSQIGYVLLGLSFGTVGAITAAFMYLVNHALAKSMLFLTAGGIIHETHTRDLRKMGGLITILPLFSAAFLIGAMSIAGFPPMGGFVSKFALFQSAVSGEFWLPLLIAVLMAVITIFYMFRTWIAIFWGENKGRLKETDAPDVPVPDGGHVKKHKISLEIALPIIALCAAVVLLGIYPEPLYEISNMIATQILDPTEYITTVLGGAPR
ncbi:Na(+)/H(+) antiporter subunit D [Methanimicrococcus sp. At1]|uniref:Na(+)/H(+) antiporter subunit D n=1 Tax=Methanimicrococcus hacksteinii TaxID=3028293 RepID=A0ABU3VQS4_9EURY|nr:proton-conducting transporter membrane subunit [Methanimicrococcus sp. At1]MDV0445768.1 Na(+)/H(+) antiporter subunit D [Methanimicrococcus sp. At1]